MLSKGTSVRIVLSVFIFLSVLLQGSFSFAEEVHEMPIRRISVISHDEGDWADAVLGSPVEIDGVRIIPVVKLRGGRVDTLLKEEADLYGAGMIVAPVGLFVISRKEVKYIAIPEGMAGQLMDRAISLTSFLLGIRKEAEMRTLFRDRALLLLAGISSRLSGFALIGGWMNRAIFATGWFLLVLLLYPLLQYPLCSISLTLRAIPLISFLYGVMSILALLLLSVLFVLSTTAIPMGLLLLIFLWISILMGTASLALALGMTLSRSEKPGLRQMFVGGALMALVRIVPVLGWISWLLFGLFGIGGVLRTMYSGNWMRKEDLGR